MELAVKGASFRYGADGPWILEAFDMVVTEQERVGIMAPSGTGKTTLCKLIAGYLKPQAGEVLLDKRALETYRGCCPVQMIWQHPELAVNPRFRMKQVLAEADQLDAELPDRLGIRAEWMDRFPSELSGGELQRFCIARALGASTRFLVADEITTMMDLVNRQEIWQAVLRETERRSIGLIAVSHNEPLLRRICTRIVRLGE